MLDEYFSYSKLSFNPSENSSELNYEMTTVDSEENLIGFHVGGLFKNTFEWLQQVKVDRIDYQFTENVAFKIELNLRGYIKVYARQIYNTLDFLGDVGGLKDGLYLFGYLVMQAYALIIGNPLNNYLLEALFKVERHKLSSLDKQSRLQQIAKRKQFKVQNCLCLQKRRHKKQIEKGLQRIDNTLEIDRFLQL